MPFRVAEQIVDGALHTAAGAFTIQEDIVYELGHPAELEPLVHCAINLDAWGGAGAPPSRNSTGEAVEAAR
ncbi:hypothetical protein ABT236_34010 [Streptomyces sp. NPDC001523]|uniref:hypothetical protein n=1 Tax=Streptomyces sp. NPDC001523 TaxID=3154383 RepID=UPI0033200949